MLLTRGVRSAHAQIQAKACSTARETTMLELCSVCRQPHHTTLYGASGLQSSLTSSPTAESKHAAPTLENTLLGEPTTTPASH